MTDMQIKLGHALLRSLVGLREQKGDLSLEDVGGIFMQMASSLNPSGSPVDEFMHQEIARLAEYITSAKQEIFAISADDKSDAAIMDASAHLDEVIKATEEATHTIMDAADAIQAAAGGMDGPKGKAVMDATNRIYEACNFQDITGQRINKVIKLLANIEERVGKLNALFGNDTPVVNGKAAAITDDKNLLNGPQLRGKAASQAEIDALFASLGGKN